MPPTPLITQYSSALFRKARWIAYVTGILLTASPVVGSAPRIARCEVQAVYDLNSVGRLVRNDWRIGQKFTVNRETGRMEGDLTNYDESREPKLLKPESKDRPLEAVTIYEPVTMVEYLRVDVSSPGKPFVFITLRMFYTGFCSLQ